MMDGQVDVKVTSGIWLLLSFSEQRISTYFR